MITHQVPMFSPAAWSCELHYNPGDPCHVEIVTPKGSWHTARALLAEGLLGPAGCLDVRVRPLGDGFVEMTLVKVWTSAWQRMRNETVLTVASSQLLDFVDATYEAVPPQDESARIAGEVDGLLSALSGPFWEAA